MSLRPGSNNSTSTSIPVHNYYETSLLDPESPAKHGRMFLGIALLITFLIYAPTLSFGMIGTFDDAGYITNHKVVQDWWGQSWSDRFFTPTIGYAIPLPAAIYALAQSVAGEMLPQLVRSISLLAHCLTGVLIFDFVGRLFKGRDFADLSAAAVACLWLLHPAHVESVVWLSNLKSTLSVLFVVAGLYLTLRAVQDPGRMWISVLLVSVVAVLGFASKPTSVVLLPMMIALAVFQPGGVANLRKIAPLIVSVLLISGVAVALSFGEHGDFAKVSKHVAQTPEFRMKQGFLALYVVARIIVFPFALSPAYSHGPTIEMTEVLPGILILVLSIIAIVVSFRRGHRLAALGLVLCALAWAPYSHIVFLPRFAADTYASLPLLGLLVALATLPTRRETLVGVGILAMVWCTSTLAQGQRWEDGEALWGPELATNPLSVTALQHVAFAQFSRGQIEAAVATTSKHHEAFLTHGRYPLWIAEMYLQVDPMRALNYGTEALLHSTPNQLTDQHYFFFLKALAVTRAELPADPKIEAILKKAVELYQQKPDWQQALPGLIAQ